MTQTKYQRLNETGFGFFRRGVRLSEAFQSLAYKLWPVKHAKNLASRAGVSERAVELWFDGTSEPSGAAIANILQSDIGYEALKHIMSDAKPMWWRRVQLSYRLSDLEQAQAEQMKILEELRNEIYS